ncbi:MAG: class I SAM-dependent methyltransferase [Deltaproteobacteria bacterium]|nr:class I SAM-dependent methyltransferase [Deltaproteobacteria bacterium]
MPDWGEIFAAPAMQGLQPNPDFLALLPELWRNGVRRVLDAGCGVGRQLLPLARHGFQVVGVDREAAALRLLKENLAAATLPAALLLADLQRLPLAPGRFELVVSINVINHGNAATFRDYCRELDRVLKPGGRLFINVSPRAFAAKVRLPQTRELEPGTLVDIATPDGDLVHHFPTPEELQAQFPGYEARRLETILTPIPFMGNVELPQLIFWGRKGQGPGIRGQGLETKLV